MKLSEWVSNCLEYHAGACSSLVSVRMIVTSCHVSTWPWIETGTCWLFPRMNRTDYLTWSTYPGRTDLQMRPTCPPFSHRQVGLRLCPWPPSRSSRGERQRATGLVPPVVLPRRSHAHALAWCLRVGSHWELWGRTGERWREC